MHAVQAVTLLTFTALSAGSQTGKYYHGRLGENEPKTGAFVRKEEGRSDAVSSSEPPLSVRHPRWFRYD